MAVRQEAWATGLTPPKSGAGGTEAAFAWEPRRIAADDSAGLGYFRYADVPFFIVYIGSSSSVYDRRYIVQAETPLAEPVSEASHVDAPSVAEQLEQLMAALALNKSLLARILRVSRPTIYEWFAGKQPKQENEERLQGILGLLAQASVAASNPLNARFVRRPRPGSQPSVIELLAEDPIDTRRIVTAMQDARTLTDHDKQRRSDRDKRLRKLGFKELDPEQRRKTLATNIGLLEWPKE